MDLADFHSQINDLANEGDSVDTQIPIVTRHAVLWLERNYNFNYMFTERSTGIPVGDATITTLDRFVKGFRGGELREVGESEGIQLAKFTRNRYAVLDDEQFEDKFPVFYAKNAAGAAFIQPLIQSFAKAYDLAYTTIDLTSDWPPDAASAVGYEHPLIDVGEDVLTARTMINLAAVTRDPELLQFYQEPFQTGIKTLLDSEFAMELE